MDVVLVSVELAIAIIISLWLTSKGEYVCEEGAVRLVDPDEPSDNWSQNLSGGRVEICNDDQWKTVCDYKWHNREAQVVCRQLGYSNVSNNAMFVRRGCAGQGSRDQYIFEATWQCTGSEGNLSLCPTQPVARGACDHRRDAGVYCLGETPDNCITDELRLVGDGSTNASGRVEICRHGCWGTVCDDSWDRNDATIACRQLGFINTSRRAIPTRGAYFGEGSGPIHLSQAHCQINTFQLINCKIDGNGINNCLHSQDAGVICQGTSSCEDGDVRLVGGETEREGRVEMCYNGVWGSVCASGWDEVAANLVCSELGLETHHGLHKVEIEDSSILFHKVHCNSGHSRLFDCVDKSRIGISTVDSCDGANVASLPVTVYVVCLSRDTESRSSTFGQSTINIETSTVAKDITVKKTLGQDLIPTSTITSSISTALSSFYTHQNDEVSRLITYTSTSLKGTVSISKDSPPLSTSALLGSVGGVSAAVLVTIIIIIIVSTAAVLIVKKRRKSKHGTAASKHEHGLDNPTYEENAVNLTTSVNVGTTEYEREFDNPLYDESHVTKSSNHQLDEKEFDSPLYSDVGQNLSSNGSIQYQNVAHKGLKQAASSDKGHVNENTVRDALENLPETSENVDTSLYSELGPTYAQCQPRIPKPTPQFPPPPYNDDYSRLQH